MYKRKKIELGTSFCSIKYSRYPRAASKRLGKLRWAEKNILYTVPVLYTSTLEEEKTKKKEKKRKTSRNKGMYETIPRRYNVRIFASLCTK